MHRSRKKAKTTDASDPVMSTEEGSMPPGATINNPSTETTTQFPLASVTIDIPATAADKGMDVGRRETKTLEAGSQNVSPATAPLGSNSPGRITTEGVLESPSHEEVHEDAARIEDRLTTDVAEDRAMATDVAGGGMLCPQQTHTGESFFMHALHHSCQNRLSCAIENTMDAAGKNAEAASDVSVPETTTVDANVEMAAADNVTPAADDHPATPEIPPTGFLGLSGLRREANALSAHLTPGSTHLMLWMMNLSSLQPRPPKKKVMPT